jgi:hypothetical protein
MKSTPAKYPKAFEHLVKNHGIILEHLTHETILQYFNEYQKKRERFFELIDHGIGKKTYLSSKHEFVEDDVFFEVKDYKTQYVKILQNLGQGRKMPIKVDSLFIRYFFLIQCKGHPSSGFLLCRETGNNTPENYKIYHTHCETRNTDTLVYNERNGMTFTDWTCFYKLNEQALKNKNMD